MSVPPTPPERVVARPGPSRPRSPDARRGRAAWWRSAALARIDDWRDRVGAGRIQVGVGVLVVVALALVAGLVWYRIGVGGAAPALRSAADRPGGRAAPAAPAVVGSAPGGSAAPAASAGRRGGLVVHVAGDVARPGVVSLPAGSRVVDALARAGGPLPDADLDRLNLAARVLDGQRILVPRVGAPVAGGDGAPADGVPLDLNTATVTQLDTLPGIGPALAAAIVAERERRGGFRSVEELGDVRGIGPARMADLRSQVAV